MTRIVVVNGPNLNLLGTREPALYGSATLGDIEAELRARAEALRRDARVRRSRITKANWLIWCSGSAATADGAIVNLGAYTHTSLALRDAFLAAPMPFVEVHLSNLFKREAARHHSVTADLAVGMITGFGARGLPLALDALVGVS